MMDYQTQLKYSYWIYIATKILQLIFQIVHIAWLANTHYDSATFFFVLGSLILLLILISYIFLYKSRERLRDENGNREEYSKLFKMDHIISLIVLIGYPMGAAILIKSKYSNRKKLYPHSIKDPLFLKVNETNRSNWELLSQTIEQIETTTNMLVDEALDMRNGLISLISTEVSSAELFDTPRNESYGIMPQALYKPIENQRTSFTILTVFCMVFHFTVVFLLHWIERTKRKIMEAQQLPQPLIEMAEINGAATIVH
ncbi:UNVERIFIED_CONTAM: hypothetical protein RMT77_007555 [Armadillidium vulgare]